ncbi:MAG: 7-cyano-7-deazaguanine synthase QueC [Proteobacteria bacterium]|nr:7-cyano-7-deazaguanine synthase QueC [Pseudomonadota bacterium]
MKKKCIVLLSGGLDSTTCLAVAKAEGYECYTMAVDYGQRHRSELMAAQRVSTHFNAQAHKVIKIDLRTIGGSALTDDIKVPEHNESVDVTQTPITYVPARNTIFMSIALGYAETIGANNMFIGVNAVDYSGYPDCRSEYIKSFQTMANLATKAQIEGKKFTIHTPLLDLTKADIIKLGKRLGINYGITVSCYNADEQGKACGDCDSCYYRKIGFAQAEITDPTVYL